MCSAAAVIPPGLPPRHVYTPYYCEENIYLLAEMFHGDSPISQAWEINVVFVSNADKTVALWDQALSSDPDYPVVWDYHCVLVLQPRLDSLSDPAWVYDYDSNLAMPSRWQDYIQATFKRNLCSLIPPQYRSTFRVVSATKFLDAFASDRSHMIKSPRLDGEPEYIKPPPAYPPIAGRIALNQGVKNNLMETFVNMPQPPSEADESLVESRLEVGKVMLDEEFWTWGSLRMKEETFS